MNSIGSNTLAMQPIKSADRWKKWRFLRIILWGRLKSPIEHPEFILYFLFVVVVIGGNGIWYSLWSESHPSTSLNQAAMVGDRTPDINHRNVISALVSYALALMTAGSADLLLSKTKYIRGVIAMLGVSLLIVSVILFITALMSDTTYGYGFGISAVILSLITWWISNAEKPEFVEPEQNDGPGNSFSPIGGAPPTDEGGGASPIAAIQGDLSVVIS